MVIWDFETRGMAKVLPGASRWEGRMAVGVLGLMPSAPVEQARSSV